MSVAMEDTETFWATVMRNGSEMKPTQTSNAQQTTLALIGEMDQQHVFRLYCD